MLAQHASVGSVLIFSQNVLIFVHEIIVQLSILIDFQADDVVLVFITLTQLGFLNEVFFNAVDGGFELGYMFLKA